MSTYAAEVARAARKIVALQTRACDGVWYTDGEYRAGGRPLKLALREARLSGSYHPSEIRVVPVAEARAQTKARHAG